MGVLRDVGGDFVLSSEFLRVTMTAFPSSLNLNLVTHSIHKYFTRVKIVHANLGHRHRMHGCVIGDLVSVQ